jgi:hypothetical protein
MDEDPLIEIAKTATYVSGDTRLDLEKPEDTKKMIEELQGLTFVTSQDQIPQEDASYFKRTTVFPSDFEAENLSFLENIPEGDTVVVAWPGRGACLATREGIQEYDMKDHGLYEIDPHFPWRWPDDDTMIRMYAARIGHRIFEIRTDWVKKYACFKDGGLNVYLEPGVFGKTAKKLREDLEVIMNSLNVQRIFKYRTQNTKQIDVTISANSVPFVLPNPPPPDYTELRENSKLNTQQLLDDSGDTKRYDGITQTTQIESKLYSFQIILFRRCLALYVDDLVKHISKGKTIVFVQGSSTCGKSAKLEGIKANFGANVVNYIGYEGIEGEIPNQTVWWKDLKFVENVPTVDPQQPCHTFYSSDKVLFVDLAPNDDPHTVVAGSTSLRDAIGTPEKDAILRAFYARASLHALDAWLEKQHPLVGPKIQRDVYPTLGDDSMFLKALTEFKGNDPITCIVLNYTDENTREHRVNTGFTYRFAYDLVEGTEK